MHRGGPADFSEASSLAHKRSKTESNNFNIIIADTQKFVKELTLDKNIINHLEVNFAILKELQFSKAKNEV